MLFFSRSCYNIFMDVVYILGSGSLANNEEIRYSVRSLEKHLLDLRNVYIIGEDPKNLPNAFHVQSSDKTKEKWKNAYLKVLRACEITELSDEFLLMNDDFFLTEDTVGEDFPFYALKGSNGGACGTNSFHVHCPMRIKKDWYKGMPFSCDQKACHSPRSFYANFYRAPAKFIDDVILRVGPVMRNADEQIAGWPFFSIGDSAMLEPDFVLWLDQKYPNPSRFE